jgi:hypothetical protein
MKLTDKRLKEFFPTDNRFIHWVAKRYGYSFYSDENVVSARYHSIINLTRYLQRHGDEFEHEGKMVSAIIYSIRYGILNSYSEHKRNDERALDICLESEFIFNANENSETYNAYTKALAVNDTEFGGLDLLYRNVVEHSLTEMERQVMIKSLDGFSLPEIDNALSLREGQSYLAKKRVQTKFKKAIKLENRNEKQQEFTHITDKEQVQKNLQFIREDNWYRSIIEDEKKRSRYIKAMSFLHPENEIQYEVSNVGLVS